MTDPFGRNVFVSNRVDDQDVFSVPVDGTYTLSVEGGITNTGPDDFTFNVQPVITTTSALTLNEVTDATIATPGEELVFDFSLAESNLLFIAPLSNSNQVDWRLVTSEGFQLEGDRYDRGPAFFELPAGDYQVVIDATGDFVGDVSFSAYAVEASTSQLATDGSLTTAMLDEQNGLQIFQFDGTAGDHFALTPDLNLQFTTSDIASETAMRFTADDDPEDGYSGINTALQADVFREGAAVNYILVTDEDRDVEEDNVTFESLFRDLSNQNALLNVVTTSQFRDDTNQRAIGVDSTGTAYIADGAGGFTTSTGGITTQSNVSIRQDYVDFAFALGGANWDLNLLRAGGVSAESFTNAFIDVKVDEILAPVSYTHLTLPTICSV